MRFKRVYIEITNTCNLQCEFCIQNTRPPRQMKLSEFEHILQEIQPYCEYIYLHVMGEPLSHPHLDAFLATAQAYQMKVNITTNGTLLKQQIDTLCAYPLRQLNVSLHSFPQHYHPTYFDDVFTSCETLAKQGVQISYRLWSLEDNKLSEESMRILEIVKERYQVEPSLDDLYRLQRLRLNERLTLHFESRFVWPSLSNPIVGEIGRCLGMKQMIGILSDGSVVPCCLDSKAECALGNLHETTLSDILDSERVKNMLDSFGKTRVSEDLCQHCSYRLRFYNPNK